MRRTAIIATIVAVVGLTACGGSGAGDPEPEDTSDVARQQTADQEQAAREAAAERDRTQAVEEAGSRLESLRGDVQRLRTAAEPVMSRVDRSLRDSVAALEETTEETDRRIGDLAESDLEAWEVARDEISSTLNDLERGVEEVAGTLEAQKQVLDRRREQERKPVTGLFEGLDGGNYEAYRVSLIREVQSALKDEGYYPGPVDGYLGTPTMEALAAFQRDHGVQPSGVPSPETRERLLNGQV